MRQRFKWLLCGILVLGLLFVSGCAETPDASHPSATYRQITAQEAYEWMNSGEPFILLDVREVSEFAQGHISGATLLPLGTIASRAAEVLPDREQTILVYCRSGRRSKEAAQQLAELGYTDVREFGGILDWPYGTVTE